MLRGLGMLCILVGCTGMGLGMAKELDLRIEELQALRQMMLALQGEIRYMHQPLPEACLRLSANAPEPFRTFFCHTAEELSLRRGTTAEEIWKRNLREDLSRLHLSRQELAEFGKLGSMLGYLDVKMQVDTLDHYLEQLKFSSAQAQEQAKGRRKLYQYMGVLAGAALVILIF